MRESRILTTSNLQVSEKEAWGDKAHARVFDYMHAMPKFVVRNHYETFNEGRLLKAHGHTIKGNRFFEVGCATGELYRYIVSFQKRFAYQGFDISAPAIESARQKYPDGTFHRLTGGFDEILQKFGQPDVVWCRDVVLHQEDPYAFLDSLIGLAKEALLVRLRTRDDSATETNSHISCQLHWDRFWVPYIVLNTDEMLGRIQAHADVSRVVISRAYEVLAGHNYRFLPQDLYFTKARTAETALLIQKGRRDGALAQVSYDDDQQDRPRLSLGQRVVRKALSLSATGG